MRLQIRLHHRARLTRDAATRSRMPVSAVRGGFMSASCPCFAVILFGHLLSPTQPGPPGSGEAATGVIDSGEHEAAHGVRQAISESRMRPGGQKFPDRGNIPAGYAL